MQEHPYYNLTQVAVLEKPEEITESSEIHINPLKPKLV
jgi:hypothetical protein